MYASDIQKQEWNGQRTLGHQVPNYKERKAKKERTSKEEKLQVRKPLQEDHQLRSSGERCIGSQRLMSP